MNTLDPTTRAWLYRIALVVIAVLVVFDVVVSGGSAREWTGWIAGVIGLGSAGLAARNTSAKRPEPLGDSDHPDNTDETPTSST